MDLSFMQDDQSLDASASPGLEPLPAEGAPMADMAGPSFASPSPMPDMGGPSVAPTPASSGAGLSSLKGARNNDDSEYLKSLPTGQKIGLMLQAFGNGVNGGPNPIDALLENKRKREVEFRQELTAKTQFLKGAIDMVKKVPPGQARDALIDMIARSPGSDGEATKQALQKIGTGGETELQDIVGVMDSPSAQAKLIKAASKADDPKKEALRLIADKDFRANLEQTADREMMPGVMTKLRVVADAMSKMPQFQAGEGKASFSMGDLLIQNDKLPPELKLSNGELGALRRNQILGAVYGMKTDQTVQKEQERKDPTSWSAPYSLNGATVQKNLDTGEVRTAVSRPPQVNVNAGRSKPPTGFRYTEDGDTLEPIPGGPKDPNNKTVGAKDIQNFSKALETSKLPVASAVLGNAEKLVAADKSVLDYATGPGMLAPDRAIPANAVEARQAIAKVFNIELKDRSGAAVTNQEMDRLKEEYGKGLFKTPAQVETALKKARGIIEDHYRSIAAGFGPDVVKAYHSNLSDMGGTPIIDLTAPKRRAGDAAPAATGKPTPSDSDRAYAKSHPEVIDKFRARFGVDP